MNEKFIDKQTNSFLIGRSEAFQNFLHKKVTVLDCIYLKIIAILQPPTLILLWDASKLLPSY